MPYYWLSEANGPNQFLAVSNLISITVILNMHPNFTPAEMNLLMRAFIATERGILLVNYKWTIVLLSSPGPMGILGTVGYTKDINSNLILIKSIKQCVLTFEIKIWPIKNPCKSIGSTKWIFWEIFYPYQTLAYVYGSF